MMIIALWQVVITRDQLKEARQERIDAGKALAAAEGALSRADEAKRSAQSIASEVDEIRGEVSEARENILAISGTSDKALGQLDDVRRVSSEAKRRLDSLDRLQQTIVIGERAQSGSFSAFLALKNLAREPSPVGELAGRRVSFIRDLMSPYRGVPSIWIGGTPIIRHENGPPVKTSDLTAYQLFGLLLDPGATENVRLYLMRTVSAKPESEIAHAALVFLRHSDSLPAVAATCGVLTTKFGQKADFLDRDKWITFLQNYGKQP
jgi:hypothetical protein